MNLPRLTHHDIQAIATEVARQLSVRMDVVMSTDQCAEYLGISRQAVVMRARRGQLPYHRRGDKMYFSRYEVNNYLLPEPPTDDTPIQDIANYLSRGATPAHRDARRTKMV